MLKPIISVENLELGLNIGVSEKERNSKQQIRIDFHIYYPNISNPFYDDNSENYICYAGLVTKIRSYSENKSFKLLEYLASELHKLIKDEIEDHCAVKLKVSKVNVVFDGANFSSSCEISD